jgi:hypothetical protein
MKCLYSVAKRILTQRVQRSQRSQRGLLRVNAVPLQCCQKNFSAKSAKIAKTAKGTVFVDTVPRERYLRDFNRIGKIMLFTESFL